MGVQGSCGIHAEVSKKDRRLGDAGRYPGHHPGSLQVERRGNYRGESNAGPYPSAIINSTEVFRIKFHGVSEGEKRDDDFERHANLKYKFGNRHFWATGYHVSTMGIQEKALRRYIQEQEKQNQIEDKISAKENENPFKGQAR